MSEESVDTVYWQAAIEHYHWDRVDQSYALIVNHGIGNAAGYLRWYRAIEAEATTRHKSVVQKVQDWLTFESIPAETYGQEAELIGRAVDACDEIARRLGWDHSTPTRITILAEEVDGEWATSPFGYCVEMEPYMKICLPAFLMDDIAEFRQAVAHEYAHVISTELTDGRAPRWLEEVVSVLVEGELDEASSLWMGQDRHRWLRPSELENCLESRGDEDAAHDEVYLAYQQCGWIGRYLVTLRPESCLADLLRAHTDESLWRNLRLVLTGRDRAHAALRDIYGFGVNQLFDRAYDYLRAEMKAKASPTK